MGVHTLNEAMRVYKKLQHLYIQPYINEQTVGFTKYDLRAIVADSVELAQDDNEINTKYNEFSDTPLLEHVILGKFQFKATCIDFQNPILKNICGFNEVDGNIYAPNIHNDIWAVVELDFGGKVPNIVIPKLKLNTKMMFSNMKTGCAENTITGTAYPQSFTVWDKGVETVGTAPLFLLPIGSFDYNVRSDYGYLLWDDGSRVLWDNGDSLIN